MAIDATVCIPWRPTPERMDAKHRVVEFWEHHGVPLVCADSAESKPFNLSQARNNAVTYANSKHVIVADADTLPDIGSVLASLDEFDGVTWPYATFRHIPGHYVNKPDLMTAKADRTYTMSVGGIFVCKRETYWELGGCDERFTGWGWEDNAFHLVAQTLSRTRRMPGVVFSFNHFDGDPRHDTYRDMTRANPNRARFGIYQMRNLNRMRMRELIRKNRGNQ